MLPAGSEVSNMLHANRAPRWIPKNTRHPRPINPLLSAGAKCDVLAVLAKLLADSGKEIRAAALKAIEVAYEFQGEGEHQQLYVSASACMLDDGGALMHQHP
jgi:hypothetical protein